MFILVTHSHSLAEQFAGSTRSWTAVFRPCSGDTGAQTNLYRRSLAYHWRTHLATTLCVATAAAVLTGALLVGDSMRGSLREMAIRRLGPVDHALTAGRFFPEDLARRIASDGQFKESDARACPLILVQGAAEHADSGARANRINILGVGDEFCDLAEFPTHSATCPAARQW